MAPAPAFEFRAGGNLSVAAALELARDAIRMHGALKPRGINVTPRLVEDGFPAEVDGIRVAESADLWPENDVAVVFDTV